MITCLLLITCKLLKLDDDGAWFGIFLDMMAILLTFGAVMEYLKYH